MEELIKDPSKLSFWRRVQNQEYTKYLMIPTFKCACILFTFIGLVFGTFGGAALSQSNSLNDYLIRYDDICQNISGTCNVTFSPDTDLVSPKVYYRIENFYANHRNFVKSRNFKQLRGDASIPYDDSQLITSCTPLIYNRDMDLLNYTSINGSSLDPNQIADPCGLAGKFFFNDTFQIMNPVDSSTFFIKESDIALLEDRNHRFGIKDSDLGQSWLDVRLEHVMVWFQMETLPSFIKLWGHMNQTLSKNQNYTLVVQNNWLDVSEFNGMKYVYLSEVNAFGGKNSWLGLVLLSMAGVVSLMIATFVILYFTKIRGKEFYTTANLTWD